MGQYVDYDDSTESCDSLGYGPQKPTHVSQSSEYVNTILLKRHIVI